MDIRTELTGDIDQIRDIIADAFGQDNEAKLVDALRDNGDLAISLVAKEQEKLVGHVAFSRLLSPQNCLALAPVSVLSKEQNRGIGLALINAAIQLACKQGYVAAFVLGNPDYYQRFGFSLKMAAKFASVYSGPHFMGRWLGDIRTEPQILTYSKPFQELD